MRWSVLPAPLCCLLLMALLPGGVAASLVPPQGTQRMVSDTVRLVGADGTGAGSIRLDLAGAQPSSLYEVSYVPASNPTIGVLLGTIRTDAAGRFLGVAPEPMPAIAESGRTGELVLHRLAS